VEKVEEKPKILEIFEILGGLVVMIYRYQGLRFRIVAIVDFNEVTPGTIRDQLGRELNPENPERFRENLYGKSKEVLFKKFDEIFIEPPLDKINGIFLDKDTGENVSRSIGFADPKEVEKWYKKELIKKGKPEELPYWMALGLGQEWRGVDITRGDHKITLSSFNSKPKTFAVKEIFKRRD
jgi:hypothetical protein